MHEGEAFQAAIPDPSSGFASDDDENRFLRCEPALSFEEALASAEGPEKAAAELLPPWARFDDVDNECDGDDDEGDGGTDGNDGDPNEVSPHPVPQCKCDSSCMFRSMGWGHVKRFTRALRLLTCMPTSNVAVLQTPNGKLLILWEAFAGVCVQRTLDQTQFLSAACTSSICSTCVCVGVLPGMHLCMASVRSMHIKAVCTVQKYAQSKACLQTKVTSLPSSVSDAFAAISHCCVIDNCVATGAARLRAFSKQMPTSLATTTTLLPALALTYPLPCFITNPNTVVRTSISQILSPQKSDVEVIFLAASAVGIKREHCP